MSDPLAASYAWCHRLTRREARNFYWSFAGLPRDRFRSMCALYACMRTCDDLGDDSTLPLSVRRQRLDTWNQLVSGLLHHPDDATGPAPPDGPPLDQSLQSIPANLFPALRDTLTRWQIPPEYLTDVIRGVLSDVDHEISQQTSPSASLSTRFRTFQELTEYCYLVAGVVGRCCIHIWGFTDPRALDLAVDCGLAFQLTNILRDLAEDADLGRVYLPAEDFEHVGYAPDELRRRINDARFHQLVRIQVERTEVYYARARDLFSCLEPSGRPVLRAMLKVYGGLLAEIIRRDFDVFTGRVTLPRWRKLLIAADAALRQQLPARFTTAPAFPFPAPCAAVPVRPPEVHQPVNDHQPPAP